LRLHKVLMSLFNKDLSVNEDVAPTPAPSAATPITPSNSFGWTASTPSLATVFTPGPPTANAGQKVSYVEEEEEQEQEQEEEENLEEEEEAEEDVIKQIAMQNPFTPSNMAGGIDKFVSWGMGTTSSTIDTPTPASAGHVIGSTPAPVAMTPSNVVPMKQGDLQAQIAAWKTKLGASSPLVHNVVATANLGVPLDLKKIALTARNAEYNPPFCCSYYAHP